ncbi:5-bromo-4-chloroindolyl phosphate hydrolysis family protein [Methylobacterium aquaticum]|uniref:5-bromo-4-chloroindolyl phosphate hydrolysis protein n=1 Tax=Methylobacterium aquaticum TaxID=270351 RepID=A0A0J6RVB4_9HYPH|nr:5-bromo-4-chloroindolyl phosphate hydrolysis family protein [Methylobacterium aquaticum]KMO26830.1 hypothetical protein VP06_32355 [Methylobacterium aquaticum]
MIRLPRPGAAADLWAGLAGGAFAPLAAFGLGLPLWVALPGAVLVFAGLRLVLAPRAPFEGLDRAALDGAALDLAGEVLAAARGDLARLREAARTVRAPEPRARLERLHAVAVATAERVEREPRRLNAARRLLTYYLPAAVRLGEGYRILEGAHRPDPARLAAAAAMIGNLDAVFSRHADRLDAPEIEGLDVELKLLADAIRAEERGGAPEPGPASPKDTASWR